MRPQKVKAKPLPIEINQDEYVEVINSKSPQMHHKIAFMLGFESGLRISEIVNLQKVDFDFGNKQIRINMGKNSKQSVERILEIESSIKEYIRHKDFCEREGVVGVMGCDAMIRKLREEVKEIYEKHVGCLRYKRNLSTDCQEIKKLHFAILGASE